MWNWRSFYHTCHILTQWCCSYMCTHHYHYTAGLKNHLHYIYTQHSPVLIENHSRLHYTCCMSLLQHRAYMDIDQIQDHRPDLMSPHHCIHKLRGNRDDVILFQWLPFESELNMKAWTVSFHKFSIILLYIPVHPLPVKLKYPGLQRSHACPVTPGLQWHWPPCLWQVVPFLVPVLLQEQAIKTNKKTWVKMVTQIKWYMFKISLKKTTCLEVHVKCTNKIINKKK